MVQYLLGECIGMFHFDHLAVMIVMSIKSRDELIAMCYNFIIVRFHLPIALAMVVIREY